MAAAAAKHATAINAVAGERLRLLPQRGASRGGVVGGADAARPPVDFMGTVTRRSLWLQRSGSGAQGGTNVIVAEAAWVVGFPAALRLPVVDGDHVERLDPAPDEPTRLRLYAPTSIRGRTLHPANPV